MTTLSHFLISITNWWAKAGVFSKGATLTLAILVLLSCQDDTGDVGFKNPNGDFEVFVKEFSIPSKTFLMDSITTSYGYVIGPTSTSAGAKTVSPPRIMVGHSEDPNFGKTTATGYTAYWPATYPSYGTNPGVLRLRLNLVFDYYWSGAHTDTDEQLFEVHELLDSMITYLPHYSNEPQRTGRLLGSGKRRISPTDFDTNIKTNGDPATVADQIIADSVTIELDDTFGFELLALAMDSVGDNDQNYTRFSRFRQKFKGFAITAPNADKIIGINLEHTQTRMILDYQIDTTKYQLYFLLSPSGQASGIAEYMSYTRLEIDRSGTPLAGLTTPYQDFEAPTGLRYVQAGAGITTSLDFSEVTEYFKNISIKALSVAELRIESDQQDQAPLSFLLRAIKPNNREIRTTTQNTDITGDPYSGVDADFVLRHQIASRADGGYLSPYYQAEILGDDKSTFLLAQANAFDSKLYTGYMTNYLQTELDGDQSEFLHYFELIPYASITTIPNYAPAMSRSVNGFYFPPDKLKLKVYYTTPRIKEQ